MQLITLGYLRYAWSSSYFKGRRVKSRIEAGVLVSHLCYSYDKHNIMQFGCRSFLRVDHITPFLYSIFIQQKLLLHNWRHRSCQSLALLGPVYKLVQGTKIINKPGPPGLILHMKNCPSVYRIVWTCAYSCRV